MPLARRTSKATRTKSFLERGEVDGPHGRNEKLRVAPPSPEPPEPPPFPVPSYVILSIFWYTGLR